MKMKMPKQGIAFRNNYPAAFLALFFLIFSSIAVAQVHQPPSLWGKREARHVTDSAWQGPTGSGAPTSSNITSRKQFGVYFDSTNFRLYVYDPKTAAWDTIHIGASTGGGSTNTSIGSAYKIAVNGTNNVKSLANTWGMVLDSATSGQVGLSVDTSSGKVATKTDLLTRWSLDGNSISTGKFIGSTNAEDVVFKANNVEQLKALSSGGIGIPNSTGSSTGVIFKGSDRFIHSFALPGTDTNLGQNLFIGLKAGNFTMTGSSGGFGTRNISIGDSTLYANTTGYRNVAIGVWAGAANTTGFENTIVGANSHGKSTTGRQNTAIGAISLENNTTGFRNTAVGFSSMQYGTTAERNVAVGGRAMQNASTGFANAALGFDALAYTSTGDHNTAVGLDALYYSNGTHNTAVGDSTLWGLFGVQLHVGYKNVAIGSRAGYHLGDTYPNYASIFDTAVTFLGANSSRDSSISYSTSLKNMTVIGYNARGFASNQVVLGNDDVTTTLLKGKVGIGTRTPTATLHTTVTGIAGSVTAGYFESIGATTTNTALRLKAANAVNNIALAIENGEGDVGIGTLTPAARLHTVGTVRMASLGTASSDTGTYKAMGISSLGDVIPMTAWPQQVTASSTTTFTNKNIQLTIVTKTASDTLELTDAGKDIEMNVGSGNSLSVPANADVAFPVGTQIVITQLGAGQTTIVPLSGVTVRSSGGKLKITDQYSGATLIKRGTNEWVLFGNLSL